MATTTVRGVDASYYLAQDLPRATKFYSELLGAPPTMGDPAMFSEWTFPNGESFGVYKPTDEFHPSGGVMFAVDDVAAAVGAAKARGVTFDNGGELYDSPHCTMGFGTDSEGNNFILHHRKED
ncbi:MAG: VOC family protein [Vulcanimicrobiaceae bacterium]